MIFRPNISQKIYLHVKRRTVSDWRQRLRDFSTIALALGTALQGAWLIFPDDLKNSFGPGVTKGVSYGLAVILLWGLVGKFVVQGPIEEPPK